ncbi:lysine-specific demethylase JMJ31 [Vicia villosa]|uniref:lysine-specific demethylase JMJ31 n=1 Tax=Vicia villosa TaxID=3911 RepID=UPI00273B3B67|nr:lysine-specific demethylase JMJ31 [Vicia villosa]
MEEHIQIKRYEELHTANEFESLIESQNVPAVLCGCIKNWRAFSLWNPRNGGLDYLQERVGSSVVEAMVSSSAPVFYGDLGSHQRVPLPFSMFLDLCKKRLHMKTEQQHQHLDDDHSAASQTDRTQHDYLSLEDVPEQIYLAQVPIMNCERQEKAQLGILREDIQLPPILGAKELSSINLWMNNAQSRSSTHYDPLHNLLCIISGRKQVVLWPPSASPSLYPMPIYGEAPNHSLVALENPDYSIYPRAECVMEFGQQVVLEAGDALFIPEGWFHQVDSDDLTIAINLWWKSNTMSCMLEHMDAYYLRRILRRLIDKEVGQQLLKLGMGVTRMCAHKLPNNGQASHADESCSQMPKGMDLKEKRLKEGNTLLELKPAAVQVLHELVSVVHSSLTASQDQQSLPTSINNNENIGDEKCEKIMSADFKDDPAAEILWDVEPQILQNVFLAMASNFPRTLEALVLHVLSPVGIEVLTLKFDEMDEQVLEEDRSKFYETFYGAFDDQTAAMNSILKGKELFTQQAFKNVLDKFVGVNLESSKPGFR